MFLGVLRGEDIADICLKLREALKNVEVFDIEFEEFIKAPSKENPKMIWLAGKENQELTNLKNKIENALTDRKNDAKKFSPHITIARAKKGDLSQEEVDQKAHLLAPVESVEILESVTGKGRRKYLSLENIPLKES
jgi:2'-5' RNA ligase